MTYMIEVQPWIKNNIKQIQYIISTTDCQFIGIDWSLVEEQDIENRLKEYNIKFEDAIFGFNVFGDICSYEIKNAKELLDTINSFIKEGTLNYEEWIDD